MSENRFDQGMAMRKSVLGAEHVARAEANKTDFDADFQRIITESAWGTIWTRPGIDKRTRHMLTLAIIAALGKHDELAMHIRATRNTGVTQEEVREVLLQVLIYAGAPAANSAFGIAKRVYQELESEGK
ncbi:MAG TPA: 4-carboxymuconolactone decarboxylase [Candidatus Binatia bacterium]|nr:4-carboxymuconolactone decarboxylase [Candidatus Binatia bacterium]